MNVTVFRTCWHMFDCALAWQSTHGTIASSLIALRLQPLREALIGKTRRDEGRAGCVILITIGDNIGPAMLEDSDT